MKSSLTAAEQKLRQVESGSGFALALLRLVASDRFDRQTKLAGALFFKNFVRRNWTNEEGDYKLEISDVTALKEEIVGLLITVPPPLQVQLGEAVSIMAESDFPARWDSLVDVNHILVFPLTQGPCYAAIK